MLGCIINYFASKWRRQRNIVDGDLRNDLIKKLNYSTRDIAINFKYAKDLRLYNMEKPLLKRLKRIFAKNQEAYKKLERRNVIVSIVCEFHKPEGCLNSVQSR